MRAYDPIPVAPIGYETIVEACRRVGASSPVRRDFNGRTVHAIVATADGSKSWLKIAGIPSGTRDTCREAEIEAEGLSGLLKPTILATSEWNDGQSSWRAVLMSLAPSDAAARNPWDAPAMSDIPESWWASLREALAAVCRVRTSRFIYTPAEIHHLIKTYLPDGLPTKAEAWRVQHGDLHWANLTLPHLMLLDWEVWGLAPVGYGAGRLLACSMLVPDVARKVEHVFADELSTVSGRVGALAAIAVVKRQIEAGNVPRDLEPLLQRLVDRISSGNLGSP